MSEVVLRVEGVSKQYRLGQVGTGTISHDLNRIWNRIRGKEDPFLQVGGKNSRSSKITDDYVWALDNISFEMKQGDVLGVIGKNGSGKSTLLKILSQITSPTKGKIFINGRISSLLEVGTGFHPELTGLENIYLNGAILGMSKMEIKSKLDEIIEFSGCEAYLNTPVKRYSSGMIVRLGFAVAAHLESELLVVDEVLAVGDQEFQAKCIGKMKDVSSSGRTILFVSHNMQSVQSLCETGLWIDEGCSAYFGSVEEAVSRYLRTGENHKDFSINLENFEGRLGTGDVQFSSVDLFVNGNPSNTLVIGSNVKIRIKLKGYQKVRCKISLHIFRFDDSPVSNVENTDSGFYIEPFLDEKVIEVDFGPIMFFPESYKVSLWAGDATTEEVFDYCRYCCQLRVTAGSVLVSRNLPRNSGVIYLPTKWSFFD